MSAAARTRAAALGAALAAALLASPGASANPMQYAPYVREAAARYGVKESTLWGVMMTESSGRMYDKSGRILTSSAGAQGLMQFMPGTARQYNVDVHDARSSIMGAAHYLSDLNTMFAGDERLALMSYNWGQGNVQRWLKSGGDWSRVPTETQRYVPKVLNGGTLPPGWESVQASAGSGGGYGGGSSPGGIGADLSGVSGVRPGCEATAAVLERARTYSITQEVNRKLSVFTPPTETAEAACLDNLLGGLGAWFALPNLADILAMLERAACAWVNEQVNQAWAAALGPINKSMQIPGVALPGVGSVGGIGFGVGQSSQPGVTIGGTGPWGNPVQIGTPGWTGVPSGGTSVPLIPPQDWRGGAAR